MFNHGHVVPNMTVSSCPIMNIPELGVMYGLANKTSTTEALVSSTYSPSVNSSITTSLTIYLDGPPHFEERHFNWADVTMEVYSVPNCSSLARGSIIFTDLQLWDANYNKVDIKNVTWSLTPGRPCQGSTVVKDPSTIVITHNPL